MCQTIFNCFITSAHSQTKCLFQRLMIVVILFKEMNKIQGIGGVKGSMFE